MLCWGRSSRDGAPSALSALEYLEDLLERSAFGSRMGQHPAGVLTDSGSDQEVEDLLWGSLEATQSCTNVSGGGWEGLLGAGHHSAAARHPGPAAAPSKPYLSSTMPARLAMSRKKAPSSVRHSAAAARNHCSPPFMAETSSGRGSPEPNSFLEAGPDESLCSNRIALAPRPATPALASAVGHLGGAIPAPAASTAPKRRTSAACAHGKRDASAPRGSTSRKASAGSLGKQRSLAGSAAPPLRPGLASAGGDTFQGVDVYNIVNSAARHDDGLQKRLVSMLRQQSDTVKEERSKHKSSKLY